MLSLVAPGLVTSKSMGDTASPAEHPAPGQPVVVVLGQVDSSCGLVIEAIRAVGAKPIIHSTSKPVLPCAGSTLARLAIVQAAAVVGSMADLVSALRAGPSTRLVLHGPAFGSLAHSLSLEIGFDEVWPEGTALPLLASLIRRALQASDVAATYRLPPASSLLARPVVDAARQWCTWQGRKVRLTKGSAAVLDRLAQQWPDAVSRSDLDSLMNDALWAGRSPRPLRISSRRVDVQISRLRREIAEAQFHELRIECERFTGYRLEITSPA